MVFRTLLRMTGDREQLEDLAQEVFLRLYRSLPNFRGESLVTTYLYRITVNVAQDAWKRRRAAQPLVSISEEESDWEARLAHPGRNAEQLLEDREFAHALEEHLLRLKHVERAVLVLYHQEEQTYAQIALTLGLPIGTVRTHLHRARAKLHQSLQNATQKGKRDARVTAGA